MDDVLAEGRAIAESLMTSTVRIRRAGPKVRNPATGREEETWTTIYIGPARLRSGNAQPQDADVAGQRITDRAMTVSLPIASHPAISAGRSGDVEVDDVGDLLANLDDPDSVGLEFRVRDGHVQTHSTARRFPVEVTSHAG